MWQGIKNIYHLVVALLANIWHGFPSRKLIVIGVTGTDGKTTTVHMIYEVLKSAGKKVSMVSTLTAIVGGKTFETGLHVTTPNSFALQRYLREAKVVGDEYFIMEVSSHGLDQNRVAFVDFAIGVFTTLAHEHLDYHKTFKNYATAKFKLLHSAKQAVVIPYDGIPKEVLPFAVFETGVKQITTYGITKGDETSKKWNLRLGVPGDFNLLNALATATVASKVGIAKDAIKRALEGFKPIPGRFEEVATGRDFRVVIDFAHKPNALEQVLKTAKDQLKGGRLITLFGCSSERDVLKRPMMGEISARLSDITVLTDDDPRGEDPQKIIDEIADGCLRVSAVEMETDAYDKITKKGEHVFYRIPNRSAAIALVLQKLVKKGDIVMLCGKGHEKTMSIRGVEEPWDEYEEVRKALNL